MRAYKYIKENGLCSSYEFGMGVSVYIEGVNAFGETCHNEDELDHIIVEVCYKGEMLDNITYNSSKSIDRLDTELQQINEMVFEYFRDGYETITGLKSDNLDNWQVVKYMIGVLEEEMECEE